MVLKTITSDYKRFTNDTNDYDELQNKRLQKNV